MLTFLDQVRHTYTHTHRQTHAHTHDAVGAHECSIKGRVCAMPRMHTLVARCQHGMHR